MAEASYPAAFNVTEFLKFARNEFLLHEKHPPLSKFEMELIDVTTQSHIDLDNEAKVIIATVRFKGAYQENNKLMPFEKYVDFEQIEGSQKWIRVTK